MDHSVSPLNGRMMVQGVRELECALVGWSRDDMMHSTSRVRYGWRTAGVIFQALLGPDTHGL